MDELTTAYADVCWNSDENRYLASVLFPQKPSAVHGVV
jgi:hypothetical protein